VNIFIFDNKLHDWVLFSVADGKGCELRLQRSDKDKWVLDFKQWDASILTLAVHKDLQFTALDSNFASIYTEDGRAVGLHFLSSSLQVLEKLLTTIEEIEREQKPVLTTYYCFSLAKSIADSANARGATMKAIGVVSKSPKLIVYKVGLIQPLVDFALTQALENPGNVHDVAKQLHAKLNRLKLSSYDQMPELERRLMQFTEAPKLKKLKTKFRGETIKVHVPLYTLQSELAPYSVLSLFDKLQEGIMVVYDALLSNKRVRLTQVIVLGEQSRAEEVASAVLAVLHMVSPPFTHLIERYVYPYATLDDIDFLNK
jgi:hypothetical protein